ncbi:MAG: metal ABC transporter substrate-binding protein [Treponema sp.]|jgi:zinc transport system substrate-binding protein|nr:metal ABC transporter substrate-binding protein [Treponema sp.]
MKKVILLLMTLAILFSIATCKQNKSSVTRNLGGRIDVTVTNFPPYDFVRQIAGDRVNLTMLLPPGSESHSFEPSPRDIIIIQNSDIFIYTGGESDDWIERILESMNTDNMKILAMIDTVDAVEEEVVEGMEEDDDEGEEVAYDEHVWTSPGNVILIVEAITALLCEADSANAGFYRQNAATFTEELVLLDASFAEVVSGAKRNTIVFADRFPFRYFADAYGLSYFAAFPGCSTETEPSAATVAFLIDKVRADKIPVVFHIELSNERMANTISGETGAKKLLLHSCHNITKRDFDSGRNYLEIMQGNVANLREALY